MDDLTERAWWVYEVPGGTIVHVPAESEAAARGVLAAHSYPGSPVETWAFIASRWCSRWSIVKSILGRPVLPGNGATAPNETGESK